MAFQETRDKTLEMATFGDFVWRGLTYELKDGRIGVVRFIGKTFFKMKAEWIGMELTKGEGKNNGTVKGVSYFSCPQGKGVFVQIDKIAAKVPEKLGKTVKADIHKPGALEIGKSTYQVFRDSKYLRDDGRDFLAPHCLQAHTGKSHIGDSTGKAYIHKEGAIETGRSKYKVLKLEKKESNSDFLKEHTLAAHTGKSHIGDSSRKTDIKKEGAIETGRSSYKVLKVDIHDSGDFLAEHYLQAHTGKSHLGNSTAKTDIRKEGALDTGKSDYKVLKVEKYLKQDGDFLKEHLLQAKTGNSFLGDSTAKTDIHKEGALETGKSGYKVLRVEKHLKNKPSGDFLREHLLQAPTGKSFLGDSSKKTDIHKEGALETGKSDYRVLKVDKYLKSEKDDFLKEHLLQAPTGKSFLGDSSQKTDVHKEGAIETGRLNYDALIIEKHLKNDGGDFLGEKLLQAKTGKSFLGDSSKKTDIHKEGALETGKSDYKVLRIEEHLNQNGDFLKEHLLQAPTGKSFLGDSSKKTDVHKEGALETGRLKYDALIIEEHLKNDGGDFLSEKLLQAKTGKSHVGNSGVKSKEILDAIRKPGPLEVGKLEYDAYKLDSINDDKYSNFLSPKLLAAHTVKSHIGKSDVRSKEVFHIIKKAGPIEIGRANYDAYDNKDNTDQNEDFLKPKLLAAKTKKTHIGDSTIRSREIIEEIKKVGPIEIGREEDYLPYGSKPKIVE